MGEIATVRTRNTVTEHTEIALVRTSEHTEIALVRTADIGTSDRMIPVVLKGAVIDV